jgi:hypothetical protein
MQLLTRPIYATCLRPQLAQLKAMSWRCLTHALMAAWLALWMMVTPGLVIAASTDPVDFAEAEQALSSVAVDFELDQLDQVRTGDQFSLALPGPDGLLHLTAVVTDDDVYINGDRVLYAKESTDQQLPSQSLTIVVTSGAHSILADIQYGDMRFAFEGQRQYGRVKGRLYPILDAHSPDIELPSDFVVADVLTPDGLLRPAARQLPSPMQMSAQGSQPASAAVAPSIAGSAGVAAASVLEISQEFDRFAVFTGEMAEIEVSISFRNTGSQVVSRLSAEVYFILEDTELISAPACSKAQSNTLPRQPILRCELPGQLPAGSSRSISYTVRMPAKTAAMRLWSTVIASNQRHDAYLNVVNDIAAGINEQGISRFNQSLLPALSVDRLGSVVVDVMTLFTPDTEALYGASTATRINQMISLTNQIYRDSGVAITLRPVLHARVEYPASDADMHRQLDDLSSNRHPAFARVPALRHQFGADIVVLFRPLDAQSDLCGLANLGGYHTMGDMLSFKEVDNAFALVAIDCPVSSALAHELGHVMGLTHSHREDGSGGTLPYATGHGVDTQFVTVMATPSRFANAARTARFSDPSARCDTLPCGVHHSDTAFGADAVRALNLVKYQVASYLPARVPLMPARRVARINGEASSARIALSVSTDKGLSFAQTVSAGQFLDISAEFYVEPGHIGKTGRFHVLADLTAAGLGMIQLNDRGETFHWDGTVDDLKAFSADMPLKPVEFLRILTDFQPVPVIQGHPLVLFLGYQLPETGELVYTTEPVIVDIAAAP